MACINFFLEFCTIFMLEYYSKQMTLTVIESF